MNSKDDEIEKLRRTVAELTAQLVEQTQRVAQLMEQVGRQAQQIEELELKLAKAQKDSSTSSKPPSSDIVKPKPKHKKPGGRRRQGVKSKVKAPRECIDYVILHELCHIAEHNHSERFYRLIKQVMPNWEKVKTRLDNMATVLLNGSI